MMIDYDSVWFSTCIIIRVSERDEVLQYLYWGKASIRTCVGEGYYYVFSDIAAANTVVWTFQITDVHLHCTKEADAVLFQYIGKSFNWHNEWWVMWP